MTIENAEEIYVAARHPKSFLSLDGAGHLLMNKKDSNYAGEVIAGWAKRYVKFQQLQGYNPSTKSSQVWVMRINLRPL